MDTRSSYQTWAPPESFSTNWTRNTDSSLSTMATFQSPHLSRSTAATSPSYTDPVYSAPVTAISTSVASATSTTSYSTVSPVAATSTMQVPTKTTRRRAIWPREEWNTLERIVVQHTHHGTGLVSWGPVYDDFSLAFPDTTRQERDLQMKVWRHWDESGIKKRPDYSRSRKRDTQSSRVYF